MTADQIFAVLTALLAGEAAPEFQPLRDGGHVAAYPVTVEPCNLPLGTLEVEGQTVICGTVSVPESYDPPSERRVPLEFAILKAQTLAPAPDPIVYLHGGPAAGTLGSIGLVSNVLFPNHRRTRDIITFDQRAAALSSTSVRCYEGIADHIVDLVKVSREDPEAPDLGDFVAPCVDEILASGADLPAYNTANNARDVQALMRTLGYPEYNIYGISYGTRLALEVMRTAPDGMRSVVIDGVAPPTQKIYDDLLGPVVDTLDALLDQCAADADCATAYPDLEGDINRTFERLAKDPIPASRGAPEITADLLFDITFSLRNNWRDLRPITPYLPRIFHELADGKTDAIDAFLAMDDAGPAGRLAATPGLGEEERTLLRAALGIAAASAELDAGVTDVITRLRSDLATDTDAVSVAEAFEIRSTEAARALSDADAKAAMLRDYALLQTTEPARAPLLSWVDTHFAGSDQSDLRQLVLAMSDTDLSRTFEIADEQATIYELLLASKLGVEIYACQEDVPWNSLEGLRARMEEVGARFPFLAAEENVADVIATFEDCAAFTQSPREGFHEPIVSDIPTLVLNGTLDIQTSWRWGGVAAETLSRAHNYIVPEAGHGSIAYQPCANDISVAFLNAPDAVPDTSCLATLTPHFILPDGSMSGGAN
ncbi:hypothetical protein GCM10011415_36150 [Salipiger pallidus]|uniref:Proline iminopeptidase n=1 Tax=Salipiger pallidus TaxID=1775170 RepID=A0A8J2ZNA1_9RHOB|nr:alpha/beta fold hydrolase [Salipiger pallidus]GGG83104.1 hypothetical protein GCM10011415_36150 [Salipiger pallidus]